MGSIVLLNADWLFQSSQLRSHRRWSFAKCGFLMVDGMPAFCVKHLSLLSQQPWELVLRVLPRWRSWSLERTPHLSLFHTAQWVAELGFRAPSAGLWYLNSWPVLSFSTYHKIHPFVVYSSVILGIITVLCEPHHSLILELSQHTKRKPVAISILSPSLHPSSPNYGFAHSECFV